MLHLNIKIILQKDLLEHHNLSHSDTYIRQIVLSSLTNVYNVRKNQ